MPRLTLSDFRGWSARTPLPIGYVGKETVNLNVSRGFLWPDAGYKILRQIAAPSDDKAGASFTHTHSDATHWPFYWWNTSIYKDTGSAATAIASGLTETFIPTVVPFSEPNGLSIVLNGTNAEAQDIRVISAALVSVLHDLAAPANPTVTANGAGGTVPTATYLVRVVWEDADGAVAVLSGPNADAQSVAITLGQNIRVVVASPPARATHYRVYVSPNVDSPASFLQEARTVVGTTTTDITALAQGAAIANRNGIYRTAVMPLTGARYACSYAGRLFIASATSSYVYWSERDAPNHWYSTNGIAETEGGWNAPNTGLVAGEDGVYAFTAGSVHRIFGDFSRDPVTFAPNVGKPELVEAGIGCCSHGSIVPIAGFGIFFMSQFGPCIITGGRVQRLGQQDIQDYMPTLDYTYAARWSGTYDPEGDMYLCAVGRKVNSSRVMDGQGVAGINDRVLRWNLAAATFSPPLELFATHLSLRFVPATVGTAAPKMSLTCVGPYSSAKQLNFGYAHGISDGVATSTDYDGKLASSSTTTSVTYTRTAGVANDLQGFGLCLTYPTDDSAYPGVKVYREVASNSYTGGNVVLNWTGALTVPSGTNWTVRLAGRRQFIDVPRGTPIDPDAKAQTRVTMVTAVLHDVAGVEAKA